MKNGDLGDYDFKPKLSKHELILERYKTLLNTSSSGEISKSIISTEKFENFDKENLKMNEINNKLSEMLYSEINTNSLNFLTNSRDNPKKKFDTYKFTQTNTQAYYPNLQQNTGKKNFDIQGIQFMNHNNSGNKMKTLYEKQYPTGSCNISSSSDVIQNIKNKYLSISNNFVRKYENPIVKTNNYISPNRAEGIFNNPEIERIRNKYINNNSPHRIQSNNISKESDQKSLLEEMLQKYKNEVNSSCKPINDHQNSPKNLICLNNHSQKYDSQKSKSNPEKKIDSENLNPQNYENKYLNRLELLEDKINKLKDEKLSNISFKDEEKENESILKSSIDSIKSVEEKISSLKLMRKNVLEKHKEKKLLNNHIFKQSQNSNSKDILNKILENVTNQLFYKDKVFTNFQEKEIVDKFCESTAHQNIYEDKSNNKSFDSQFIDPPKIKNKIYRSRTNSTPKKKIQSFEEFIQNQNS